MRSMSEIVALQTENLKALVGAREKARTPERLRGDLENQAIYVETKVPRCPRCGELVFSLVASGGGMCGECLSDLREKDRQELPEASWFCEVIESLRAKQQGKDVKK